MPTRSLASPLIFPVSTAGLHRDRWPKRASSRNRGQQTTASCAGNDAALGLFRAVLGVALTRHDGDTVHLVGLVGDRGWEITMDDIMADLAG